MAEQMRDRGLSNKLVVPLLCAAIAGGIEMRVRIGTLQAGHEETVRRLERIERLIDTHSAIAKTGAQDND